MADIARSSYQPALGVALAGCGLATLLLLFMHPHGGAHSIQELLADEARDQVVDGVVHGGFIGTLAVLVVCFVYLARRLGTDRVNNVVGVVAFCIGSAALMASMILDGFVVPAISARYTGSTASDALAIARTGLVLCGTLIRFLLPMGLIFQGIALVAFSSALAKVQGFTRVAGAFGLCVGALLAIGTFFVPAPMAEHFVLLGFLLQGVWYVAIAIAIFRAPTSGWMFE